MDILIQIAAACGPIALAIMGVIVSLRPPHPMAHKFWAGSFVAVGVLSAASIFFELRGSDQLLGQIWERVRESSAASGRHLSADQRVSIIQNLSTATAPHLIYIMSSPSCDECERYAQELRDAVGAAPGWTGGGAPSIFGTAATKGIKVFTKSRTNAPEVTRKVVAALTAAKIKFDWDENPNSGDAYEGGFLVAREP